LEEVGRLVASGYREIVLTGVHLGHYGVDWNWRKPKSEWIRLSHLVERIAQLEGDFRIRLSSIEATEVTHELIAVMRQYRDRICPHLHICLQSGSDAILRRMRRRWSARMFVDRCQLVRDRLEYPALTTDVIVGFPGETEEDFEQTCRLVREVGFSKIHVFPFSARRGTPAAGMPDQLPKRVRSERGRELAAIEETLRKQYFEGLIGRPLRVLVESTSRDEEAVVQGTSCRYAPVALPGDSHAIGRLVDAFADEVIDTERGVRCRLPENGLATASSPSRQWHLASES
jgi:threonylcarbamoyladenosine tRNA methylthiotransferase MtaB